MHDGPFERQGVANGIDGSSSNHGAQGSQRGAQTALGPYSGDYPMVGYGFGNRNPGGDSFVLHGADASAPASPGQQRRAERASRSSVRSSITRPPTENAAVSSRSVILTLVHRAAGRRTGLLVLLASLGVSAGCDRIKRALKDETALDGGGDPVWQGDSTMLATKPGILFRIIAHEKGRAVSPIATVGPQGFRQLTMGGRGWRAFDVNYLQAGNTLSAIRNGHPEGEVRLTRGMWEGGGAQLDSLPGCPRYVPAGLAEAAPDVALAVSGVRPTLKTVAPMSAGELQAAISTIPTLIAPSSGIATSMLSRYKREVHVLYTGTGPRPSILVTYNDPEQVSDTLKAMGQRPRQFVVVLDKGVYGYRPTYTFSTLGNAITPPRITFLDYVDVDSDGKAELFFAYKQPVASFRLDATITLRFDSDAWRESLREMVRCQL